MIARDKISSAIKWRVNFYKQQLGKSSWKLQRILDLSKKEKVDAVSVIVVGRNDNYGGDFSDRLRATLDWNLKHLPNPELIYVEWNQIEERESDCTWISKRYPNSKCYIVSSEIHQSICTNPKMPLMEYHGKNLGMRRAGNNWILMINADVFIGLDVAKNIRFANRNHVYGTHYKNIEWDKKPIATYHIEDKAILKNYFSAPKNLGSVVGNFIFTHRDNWLKATGYDEKLTDVRGGVDTNGLKQLMALGLKPMTLGHHYHLDHNESIIHGSNPTHGANPVVANGENIPYENPENWGMTNFNEVEIKKNIWRLEKI